LFSIGISLRVVGLNAYGASLKQVLTEWFGLCCWQY
jgi:hypothetical protein